MIGVRRDHDAPRCTRFTATAAHTGEWRGRPALALEETWFYPEGGGQPADRGCIGAARVLDVQQDDDGTVWHVVDQVPAGGPWPAEVDWARRFDHMQQHTGQHVLSAAVEHAYGAATLSSTLGEEHSVIEVALAGTGWDEVQALEARANAVLWEDRAVVRHWTDADGVAAFALRKPTRVAGPIRIVEIPGWDTSACGGTHVERTGEVGLIKIVGWERVRGHVRFAFLCGGRALADHAWRVRALQESARRFTVAGRDVLAHLERLAGERAALVRELEQHRLGALEREAREAVAAHGHLADWRVTRTRAAARRLALLAIEAGGGWAVAAAAGPEPTLVLARPRGSGPDLRTWLPALLERTQGKGGGAPELLTLAPADADACAAGYEWACDAFRGAGA